MNSPNSFQSSASGNQYDAAAMLPPSPSHNEEQCRDRIQHLEEIIAARDGKIKELEKLDTTWKRMVGWKRLCLWACTGGDLDWWEESKEFAQAGEHASAAAIRAGLKDAVTQISQELKNAFTCDLRLRVAFLQNGVYETKWKDAHIIAIGFVGRSPQEKYIEFAPLHYDLNKKAWIDLSDDEWSDFVRFTVNSSCGKRLVCIQPNLSPQGSASRFQITEYEVCGDGNLGVIRMWKKFGLWRVS